MSGHNKWSQIKRTKGINDAAKGKIFTKIGKEILVAVKQAGPNPDSNTRLKEAIAKARENNMPNDNIQRCIKNAISSQNKVNYESITYEGYGPGGVAVMVETLTDNKNRTAGEIRHAFEKHGGSLGVAGSVSYIFISLKNDDGTTEVLPDFTIPVPEDKCAAFEKLLDMLEDNEDVQEVIHNGD